MKLLLTDCSLSNSESKSSASLTLRLDAWSRPEPAADGATLPSDCVRVSGAVGALPRARAARSKADVDASGAMPLDFSHSCNLRVNCREIPEKSNH